MTTPISNNGRPAPADLAGPTSTMVAVKQRSRLGPFEVVWQFWKDYAEQIAHYQTAVLLTIIFYGIAGPTALLARLAGHRFLPELPRSAATFWYDTDMGRPADPGQYLRQF
jgi:hypothetical protein